MKTLCIDFGGTEIKIGVLDGSIVRAATAMPNRSRPSDLGEVIRAAQRLGAAVDSVGIALPGVVHRRRGTLVAAPGKYAWAIGHDFRAWSRDAFGLDAVVENDARSALLGETVHGCAAGVRDAVLITLGTGIGTAARVDGVLVRGPHDHAAILGGHITVDVAGPHCVCGNIGCAEAIASTWALQRDAAADAGLAAALANPDGSLPGLKDLFTRRHRREVAPVLDRYVEAWSAAIVGMCHAYDPETVIVSGGVLRSASLLLPRLTRLVHEHLWSSSFRPPLITPEAPEHSVLLGLSAAASRKDHP